MIHWGDRATKGERPCDKQRERGSSQPSNTWLLDHLAGALGWVLGFWNPVWLCGEAFQDRETKWLLHEIYKRSKVKYSIVCDFYLCECKRELASSWEWTWLLWRAIMKRGYSMTAGAVTQSTWLNAFLCVKVEQCTCRPHMADCHRRSWTGAYFVLRKYWAMGSLTSLSWLHEVKPMIQKDFTFRI